MLDRNLFTEKIVPERTLTEFELIEKRELARKHGVKFERQAQIRQPNQNYNKRQTIQF